MNNLDKYVSKINSSKIFRNQQHEWLEIEDFLSTDRIDNILEEINNIQNKDNNSWIKYETPLENKMTNNTWNDFGPHLYQVFALLVNPDLVSSISKKFEVELIPDVGLHGGGIHISRSGGRLDPHLDYAIHPKMDSLRYINAILFLTSQGDDFNGGSLGFWNRASENIDPPFGEPDYKISPEAGKLILFNVSGYNWHGLCEDVSGGSRISLASYYVTSKENAKYKTTRSAAVFSATSEREINSDVKDAQNKRLIKAGLK
tara:strand:+ start:1397 stop:2173 length:777 start_codon:yes stop_codon:yes gene_type:complete